MAIRSTYKVLRADASTTLNEIYPSQSFHLDETMTVGKVISSSLIGGGPYRKRAMFTFGDWSETTGYDNAYLKVFEAKTANLARKQNIEIGFGSASSPLGNSFEDGTGRRDSRMPINDGSTWKYSNSSLSQEWLEQTASVKVSFGLETNTSDIDQDVTTLLGAINTQNHFRFVHLNFFSVTEDSAETRGEIEYYSSKTHTIYKPTLYHVSKSLALCTTGKEEGDIDFGEDYIVYHKNLQPLYQSGSITFKFGAKNLFAASTYGTASSATDIKYIPSASTYNFKDVKSNELVLPKTMQDSLAIESSTEAGGHYISSVPTNLFYPYRKYQLVLNIETKLGTEVQVLPETFQIEA